MIKSGYKFDHIHKIHGIVIYTSANFRLYHYNETNFAKYDVNHDTI